VEEMKMDQIEKLVQRPKFYGNVDGVGELGVGFAFLGLALLLWPQIGLPDDSIWNRMDVSFVCIGLLFLVSHYGAKAIKTHITYPRTGFAKYRTEYTIWSLVPGILGIIGIVLILTLPSPHWDLAHSRWKSTIPNAGVGLVLTTCYAVNFARPIRWKWVVAGLMAISTVAIASLPAEVVAILDRDSRGAFWFTTDKMEGVMLLTLLLFGAIQLISGSISFVLYLRHTQPAAETAE
jgi:hypothetical protein